MKKWHLADYEELIQAKGWPNMLPGFAKARCAAQAETTLEHPQFTLEGLLDYTVRFVIGNDQEMIRQVIFHFL